MNKVFSIVWNHALQAWTVASEKASRRGKRTNAKKRAFGAIAGGVLSSISLSAVGAPPSATELPTNGQVVGGQIGISQSNNTMNINQSSQQGIINWQSFNVGSDATVNFNQPNSNSATLNRVTSGGASQIFGNLNANGQVFVVNPNGVLFGQSARVDVGGLVASALAISNDAFMSGNYEFSGDGSEGGVINQGELLGEYVAMLAPEVRNEGVVIARQGTVAMAAGETITLSISGEQLVDVQVSKAQFDTLVENRHLIEAAEGLVILSAQSAADLLGQTVNTGAISAGGLVNDGGTVRLVASSEIAHSGSINVDGGENGNGGDAILLANLDNPNSRTDISGTITSRGGANSGGGGFIETSASDVNIADSASIDTSAANGETGDWLIDPTDFTIGVGGDIDGTTLETQLAANNVTIESVNGASGTNGDIFVNESLTWDTNQLTLTADRNIEINAELTLTSGGGLNLEFGQAGSTSGFPPTPGNYFVNAPVNLASDSVFTTTFGNDGVTDTYTVITDEAGLLAVDSDMTGNYVLGADISASTDPWNPLGNATGDFAFGTTGYTGIFDGLGHTIDGLTRANTANSTGIGLFGQIGDQFAPGGVVQNLGLTNVNLAGLSEVGALAGANFGIVSNVYSTGTVTGGDVVGPTNDDIVAGIGGLIGTNGGLVGLSYSSVDVTATTGLQSAGQGEQGGIGGLVGINLSNIDNSYATGSVSGGTDVGGLAGYTAAPISFSYSSGAVSGAATVGGLVGAVFNPPPGPFASLLPTDFVFDSFWNTTSSGQASSAGGGTGLSDAQAQQQSSYTTGTGFDFTNTWVIYEGISQPLLRSMLTPYYVTVDAQSKTYNGNAFAGFTSTESESTRPVTITGTLAYSGGGTTATDAGSYAVSVSGLDLTAAAKEDQQGYLIQYVDGTVTIDQAALTVTAGGQSKIYGDTLTLDTTEFSSSGLVTGELIDSVTLASANGIDVSTTADADIYTDEIVASGVSGSGGFNAANYDITYEAGDLTVGQRAITVSAGDQNKSYGDALSLDSTAFTTGNLANSEQIDSVTLTSASGVDASTTADAGTYADEIAASAVSGSNGFNAANYNITYQTGDLTVDQRVITVSADDQSKTYGDALALDSTAFTTGNLANSEQIDEVTLTSTNGVDASTTADAGTYIDEITASDVTGSNGFNSSNYAITYESGDLVVDQRNVTVTLSDQSKIYGDALTLDDTAFIATNLVNSNQIDAINVASAGGVDSNASADAGTYTDDIVGSGVTGSNGFNAGNYAINYVAADLVVDQRALTVTANDQNKTYGDDLSGSSAEFSATGLATGDSIDSVTLAGVSASDTGASVGTYVDDLVASDAVGGSFNAANYAISYGNGDLTVDPALLTVTADDQSIAVGNDIPELTQTITGFVNGETLGTSDVLGNGEASTTATTESPAGNYDITSGTGDLASSNYTFAFVDGILSIGSDTPTNIGTGTETAVEIIQETLNENGGSGAGGSSGTSGGTVGTGSTEGGSQPDSENDAIQQGADQFCESCISLASDNTGTTTVTTGREGPAAGTGGLTPAGDSPLDDKVIKGLITQAGQADLAAKRALALAASDPDSLEKKVTASTLKLKAEQANKAVDDAIEKKVSEQNAAANQAPATAERKPKDRSDQVDELIEALNKKGKVFGYAMQSMLGGLVGGTNDEFKKQRAEMDKINAEADVVLKKYDVTNIMESDLFGPKVQALFDAQSNSNKVQEEKQAAAEDLAEKKAAVADAKRKAKASKEAAELARKEADADPGNLQKAMNAQFAELKASSDGGDARKAEVDVSTAEATLSDKEAKVATNEATIAIGRAELSANLAEKEKADALEKTRQTTADAGQKAIAIEAAKLQVAEAEVEQQKRKEEAVAAGANVEAVKAQQVAANDTFNTTDIAQKAQASALPALVTDAEKQAKEAETIVQNNAIKVEFDKKETLRQGSLAEIQSFYKPVESLLGSMRNAYGNNFLVTSGHSRAVYDLLNKLRSLTIGSTVESAQKAADDAKAIAQQVYNLAGGLGNDGINHERNRLGNALNPNVLKTANADAQDAYFQHTQRELQSRQAIAEAAQAKAAAAQQAAAAATAELDRLNQALLMARQNKELAPAQLQAAIRQAEEAKQNVIRAGQMSSQLATEVERAETLAAAALEASLNAKAASEEAIKESAVARKAADKIMAQQAAEEKAWNDKAVAKHKESIAEMSSYADEAQAAYKKAADLSNQAKVDQKKWQTLYDTKTAAIPGLEKTAQQDLAAAAAAKAKFDATGVELEQLEAEFKVADDAQLEAQVVLARAQAARDALETKVKVGNILEIAGTIASAASNTQEKKIAAQARLVAAQEKYDQLLKVAVQKRDAYNATADRRQAEADIANKAADTAAKSSQAADQAKLDKDVAEKNVAILGKYAKETSDYARKMFSEADKARTIVRDNA